MLDQIKSSSRSWPNLAALACVLFGTILVGGVTPAIASPKRIIIVEYPGAGFPPLIDAGRPDCMKIASLGETPPTIALQFLLAVRRGTPRPRDRA